MIRHRQSDSFLLFTQDDHARLSGALAAHVGNQRFDPPNPREAVVEAIAMHDSGWPLHDDRPTLDPRGFPLHVFETPIDISSRVWSESVRRASERHPYGGLLVSMHVMALSAIAHSHFSDKSKRLGHARELFIINQFQQNQIELQESLRQKLGLRVDQPLKYGLPAPGISKDEDQLLFNYQMLKAMDRISLCMLCADQPFNSIDEVYPRPGDEPIELRISCKSQWALHVEPWPFDVGSLDFEVPYRRLTAQRFDNGESFAEQYIQTPIERLHVAVNHPGTGA